MAAPKVSCLLADDWDVLVAADALAATARGNWNTLARLGRLRAYGFLPANQTHTERERLRVEAVFGTPLVPAKLPPRATVHFAIPPWMPSPPEGISALARKRTAIWENTTRNGYLAAVALAASAHDDLMLTDLGFGNLGGRLGRTPPGGVRVAILVESPAHARHLLPTLGGWRLIVDEPRPWRGGWGGHNPTAPLRDPEGWNRCILTTMAARRVDRLDVDVLIRADGAGSPLRIPGFPDRDGDRDHHQILIDLADDFDAVAKVNTKSRIRGYLELGWDIYPARLAAWASASKPDREIHD